MKTQLGKRKNVVFGREVPSVSEIPYYAPGIKILKEDFYRFGLDSAYRYIFARGQGASSKDRTWNKERHMHVCCKSHYPWRHLAFCPKAIRNAPDDLSDLVEQNS